MSAQPPPQKEDTFHQARSRLIDAYARLEARLVKLLTRAGRPIKGDTGATKLKTVREAATPESVAKTNDAFERLASLALVRADLVHGAMHLIDIDGERFATFRNAREAGNKVQKATHLSYKSLKSLAEEVDSLSAILNGLALSPPNLSPRPAQDATNVS